MYNVSYHFAGTDGVKDWDAKDESLKGLRYKLDSFFVMTDNKTQYDIRIVWIDYAALMSDKTINESISEISNDLYKPSIVIGTQPVFRTTGDAATIYEKKLKEFDNNIYCYYCQVDKWDAFRETLSLTLNKIRRNYELKLYESQVTKEFFEFYLRMILNNSLSEGHSSAVMPFVFTSEQEMLRRARECATLIRKHTEGWGILSLNLLLVDDHSINPLTPVNSKSIDLKSKMEVLSVVLKEFMEDQRINIEPRIQVISAPDVDQLMNLDEVNIPDIILLDYNFNTTESGVDFIRKLRQVRNNSPAETDKPFRKGPYGKFWLFPITSFSNAFIDELQNKGLGFIDDEYELSRGADFINTPNLFLFYMMQMIWDIIRKGDLTGINGEIERLSGRLELFSNWENILKAKDDFEKEYSRFVNNAWNIEYILDARTGILNDVRKSIENNHLFRKKLSICKELLFNLTSKNYDGNEDIIILINQLKRTMIS